MAAVQSAPSLELVGSCVGTAHLSQQLADTHPDVLLERLDNPLDNLQDAPHHTLDAHEGSDPSEMSDLPDSENDEAFDPAELPDLDFSPSDGEPSRVALVPEATYAAAWNIMYRNNAAIPGIFPRAAGARLRALLPVWATENEICGAIVGAAQGLFVVHPDVLEHAASQSPAVPHASPAASGQALSPREGEILNLLAAGLGNKEIAWQLKISEHTVKFHVTSIFNKLSASTRAEAVAVGMRRGLISL